MTLSRAQRKTALTMVLMLAVSTLGVHAQPPGPGMGPGGPRFGPSGTPGAPADQAAPQPGGEQGGEGEKPQEGEKPPEGEKPQEEKLPPNYGFAIEDLPEEVRDNLEIILPRTEPAPEGMITMSFKNAEVADFLQFMSDMTGLIFVPHPDLSGQVTITSPTPLPTAVALTVLESWLAVRGYAMTVDERTSIARIEPYSRVRTRPMGVGAGLDLTKIGTGFDYITQVLQLERTDAEEVRNLIRPLVDSEAAILTASAELNAIVITDTADNVRRIAAVIAHLESADTTEVQKVEVIPLTYATAQTTATLLTQLFEQPDLSPMEIQQMIQRAGGDASRLRLPGGGLIGIKGQVKVVSDERTNSIVVLAAEQRMEIIRTIVAELDRSEAAQIDYRIFDLTYADATTAANLLNELFEQPRGTVGGGGGLMFGGGFRSRMIQRPGADAYGLKENVVVADVRTNQLIVTATKDNMNAFEALIEELDSPKALTELTRVYKLKNSRAQTVAETLNAALRGQQQFGGFLSFLFGAGSQNSPLSQLRDVYITAESTTNQIIVTAPPQAFDMMDSLINELDQRIPQVFVRVIIADITLTEDDRFGVGWNWFAPNVAGGVGTTGNVGFANQPEDGLRWAIVSQSIQAFINALDTRGNVEIISTPHIMTLDNQQGRISVGREIPTLGAESESTSGRVTNSIEYIPVNIDLQVTPHVTDAGFVSMDIRQNIDDIGETTALGNPVIIERRARTNVLVKDGQTVVLGGIISETRRDREHRVPVLSEIPLLGNLFRSKREEMRRSELMVFLTPYIIVDEKDASDVTRSQLDQLGYPLDVDPSVPDSSRWDADEGEGVEFFDFEPEATNERDDAALLPSVRRVAGGGA